MKRLSVEQINKLLANKHLDETVRENLKKKKQILLNQKTVQK